MTTRIPDAAVQAAASVVTQATNCTFCDDNAPCGICVATTLAALTVALPLLGDIRIEYGVQYTADGGTFTARCQSAEHAKSEARDFAPGQHQQPVSRTIITGPWQTQTEAPSE